MSYKRGINVNIVSSETISKDYNNVTIPVYIGLLPVHQLQDYTNRINNPIVVNSFDDVYKTGYSDDWKYTLCEPIYAHFKNDFDVVGPIVLINVLDPSTNQTIEKAINVNFVNGVGKLSGGDIIRDTITISDLVIDEDFKVEYSQDGQTVVITDLSSTLDGDEEVRYKEIDLSGVNEDTIIGKIALDGKRSGIKALPYVYSKLNMIPGLLLCPGYSHLQRVHDEMIYAANNINNHWNAFAYTDLPCDDSINTVDKAIKCKTDRGYTSPVEVTNYPKAYNKGKMYHLSVLRSVVAQKVDNANKFPNDPPSNQVINIQKLVLDNSKDIDIDEIDTKKLNSVGISTAIKFEGSWRTWGVHTSAYTYDTSDSMDPRDMYESSVRVVRHLGNVFQRKFWDKIDKGLNKGIIESIINDFQRDVLDLYVSQGKLLYGTIEFLYDENPASDMLQGDFKFNIDVTGGLVVKSITALLRWTPKGINLLFEGGE